MLTVVIVRIRRLSPLERSKSVGKEHTIHKGCVAWLRTTQIRRYLQKCGRILVNDLVGRRCFTFRILHTVLRLLRHGLQFFLLRVVDVRSKNLPQLVHARDAQLR